MDKFDQAILAQLRTNARASVSSIAQQVNLSRSSVTERIKKMENNGTIKGYHVSISEAQKSGVQAYLEIQHCRSRCADVVPMLRKFPEIETCHGITGDMDLLVYVKAESMQRIHEIREFIDNQADIVKIKTHVVMSEWIDNRG